MQFMAISVGVLAIVGTLLLLFGRVETRKILGRLFASVAGLAIGAAAAMLSFYYGIGHTGAQSIISALGVANTWLVVGASVTVLLLIATVEARTGTLQAFVVPVAAGPGD